MLSESDIENAAQLYIMSHFETSIGVKSPDFRVCDIFSYQENKMNVICEYQTLLDFFYNQVEQENQELNEGE